MAKDADLTVDTVRYQALEEEAKERSRSAHKTARQTASENLFTDYVHEKGESEFLGYAEHASTSKVAAIVVNGAFVDSLIEGQEGMIVLDRTPFYAEMGGQVGDIGSLRAKDAFFQVCNTISPYKGIVGHVGKMESGRLCVGDSLAAAIDSQRRQKIANNHTATHLLHWALHKVLGEHVKQAGSVVEPGRLRFDFSHHKAVSRQEIEQIEDLVNEKIRENLPVRWYELPYEEAQKREDVKQFFGEKYGSTVRVIDIDYSKELCGGTHTPYVGTIGYFRISKESSIAAGVRRIEAVTGAEAEQLARGSDHQLAALAEALKAQVAKLPERVEKLLEENKQFTVAIKEMKKAHLHTLVAEMMDKIENISGIPVISLRVDIPADELKICAEEAITRLVSGVVALGCVENDRCSLIIRVSDNLVQQGVKAGDLVKAVAPLIEGSGGGKPNNAQAGGKSPQGLSEALNKVRTLLQKE